VGYVVKVAILSTCSKNIGKENVEAMKIKNTVSVPWHVFLYSSRVLQPFLGTGGFFSFVIIYTIDGTL
jgi:hypothetical protein